MSVSAVIKTVVRLVFVAGCYALKLFVIVVIFSGQDCAAMHFFELCYFQPVVLIFAFSLSFLLYSFL